MDQVQRSKAEASRLVRAGIAHELYISSTDGEFDVTTMRKLALAGQYGKPHRAELTPELVRDIKERRDWEQARIDSLTSGEIHEPSLWIYLPSDQHLLIDGTHRILRRVLEGLDYFLLFLVPLKDAVRPTAELYQGMVGVDWGRMEIRDGKLYDRKTGKEIT